MLRLVFFILNFGKINYNVTEFYDSLTRTYIRFLFPADLLPAGTNNFTSRTSYIYEIIAKADDVVVNVNSNSNISTGSDIHWYRQLDPHFTNKSTISCEPSYHHDYYKTPQGPVDCYPLALTIWHTQELQVLSSHGWRPWTIPWPVPTILMNGYER